jgi:2-polyprenyl-3-methyl-5-hydroxy-6-metoxy-1,4-benzoquinol methylase
MAELDPGKADAFVEKLVGILNNGSLALMVSIGHRTKLFDTLAELEPSTSGEVAAEAGLNERYVREWLGAMVVGQIVEYDPGSKLYRLPSEHAAALTRAAGADNLAPFGQYVAVLGNVEDKIVECFHNGGGVPYSEFDRFHEVMAEDSYQSVVSSLNTHILPLVPGLVDRLDEGLDVLDVGCGSGRALNHMAADFPKSRFTGYDFSEETIGAARKEAEAKGVKNVTFEEKDVTHLTEREAFDFITTFDAIHDQADPAAVLKGIAGALKADGVYLMQDIAGSSQLENNLEHPLGPFLYTISTMHCMTVSLALGGAGLGTMWGEELARKMLKEAGFRSTEVEKLEHDPQNYYYINQKK